MPLLLTTPFPVGAFDASDYTHAKISRFSFDVEGAQIQMLVRLGYYDEQSVWHKGRELPETVREYYVTGEDFAVLAPQLATSLSETLYDQVAATLYQWLIDKGHYAGTIV